ncbi:heavy-metal-associated domain-containing protein [Kordiimonas sp. SCSIO 12603]|uniref:heavy-metal-associated domain-containing protein n=1 Tax=Kordiimonas sp. SCSIO 12603 TaxID=2829596 RepID=UPI002102BB1E|nr:cation transporter [Kordiimonas sp. SCSIO 12603]UTW57652.1 heavy-metal-associated domain-containing protein [Kordiimonas sp. SCSIO 12603]
MKNTITALGLLVAGTFVPAIAEDVQYDIKVDGITCPFCVATSEKALKKIEGVRSVTANLETGIISVCGVEDLELTEEQLRKLFRKKGFTYREFKKSNSCSSEHSKAMKKDADK